MIGFFLKKSFFDAWDHLFSVILLNVGFIVVLALGILVPGGLALPGWAAVAIRLAAIAAGAVWWSTCVYATKDLADFGGFRLGELWGHLKLGLAPGLQAGAALVLGALVVTVGLPFYLSRGGVLGALAAGLIFWCAIIVLLALQYYVPLRARLGGGFRKNLRKCFLMFFDNPGFSVFLFVHSVLTMALSFFLAFLLPGLASVCLAQNVALRLRMRKYDWLEANPDANRRAVPWDELLEEDRELVGKRTLKGMFFPWKE